MLVRRLAALLALTPAVARALWPLPRSIQSGTSVLKLSPSFDIHISDSSGKAPQDLQDAITRTKFFLQNDKLGRLIVGRGSSDADALSSAPKLVALTLELTSESREEVGVASIAIEARKPLEDRDEAYTLNVPADGSPATLAANTTLGLFRGLTTFGQMWYHYGGETYAVEMPVSIVDSPAYPYRGLLLDTARNFFPVGDIKRTLDAMSMVKISTFFWHVVDSQSFPLQIPGFMNVSGLGAYDDASVYTPEDVQDIVSYAGERGIDVLLELDTPGHTTIISKSYPEHVACPELSPWATYANEPPAGQLRFVQPETAEFTANLLAAAATMFPSQYISTGGDEVNIPCYEQDDRTVAILNQTGETLFEAMSSFIAVTHRKLEEMGKTPVVKEEMVLEYNVTTLSNETLVLVWISSEDASAVAQKGYRFIHYASNYFYLDCGGGEWLGADPDGNSWCDPFKTWQKSYSFDPVANLTEAEKLLVMGGQQPLWTEQSGPQNLDPIVWPRAASSAELYWSGPGGNVSTALPRLHDVAYRMRTRGIQAISLQPEWCALRPGACDLTA